jgi:hypothetical protein
MSLKTAKHRRGHNFSIKQTPESIFTGGENIPVCSICKLCRYQKNEVLNSGRRLSLNPLQCKELWKWTLRNLDGQTMGGKASQQHSWENTPWSPSDRKALCMDPVPAWSAGAIYHQSLLTGHCPQWWHGNLQWLRMLLGAGGQVSTSRMTVFKPTDPVTCQ